MGRQPSSNSLSPGWQLPNAYRPFGEMFWELLILNVGSCRKQSFNAAYGEGRRTATYRRSVILHLSGKFFLDHFAYEVRIVRLRLDIVIVKKVFHGSNDQQKDADTGFPKEHKDHEYQP